MKEDSRKPHHQGRKPQALGVGTSVLDTKMKVLAKIFLTAIVAPALLYALFFLFLRCQSQPDPHQHQEPAVKVEIREVAVKEKRPTYWVHTQDKSHDHLQHVFNVLDRLGFDRVQPPPAAAGSSDSTGDADDWDLIWSHDFPFIALKSHLDRLKPHQRLNHVPGTGYITNKVDLATTRGSFIPRAFKLPDDAEALLEHAKAHPQVKFVQKSNDHRGVRIARVDELDLNKSDTFAQEFVDRPLLVDGYKFDIGIYTVMTSIEPLRLYVYKGDVLFRFCPEKYEPFDPEELDKYVVADDYLPIWDAPSLRDAYTRLGFSSKETFDDWARRVRGVADTEKMWRACYDAIKEVALQKQKFMRDSMAGRGYPSRNNFFELVRFDFVVDEEFNVYMMEANMSPNLSSAHYPANRLLYEQLLYDLFALVGLGQRVRKESMKPGSAEEESMQIANKNLVVFPELCAGCNDCFKMECQLCLPCHTPEIRDILSQSYWEHYNKMDYLRIFPPPIKQNMVLKNYSSIDQLLIRWYQGKCAADATWCN